MSILYFEATNGGAYKRLIVRQRNEEALIVRFWDNLNCKGELYEVPDHYFYSFLPMLLFLLEIEGEQTPESIAFWLGEPLVKVVEPI